MTYESFVAYSCIAIIIIATIAFFRWIDKENRDAKKRRAEFEKRRKEIERAIRQSNEIRRKSDHAAN